MTTSHSTDASAAPTGTPVGVRVAALLASVVGAVTLLAALTMGFSQFNPYEKLGWLPLATSLVAGIGACSAAVLIWRMRRLGVLVLVLAWAAPTFAILALGEQASGSIFLTGSLLFSAANWRSLH